MEKETIRVLTMQLEKEIHQTIPLSEHMGFAIEKIDDTGIEVHAPLRPNNINIHQTGFAGSLYSIAALTAWAKIRHAITSANINAAHLIAKADITYFYPVTDNIVCRCKMTKAEKSRFLKALQKEGKSRVALKVNVYDEHSATEKATVEFLMQAKLNKK